MEAGCSSSYDEADGQIRCTVVIERLGPAAAAPSRVLLREAWVTLVRDEFRALALQVAPAVAGGPGAGRPQTFPLPRPGEVRVFTRFITEGKSSVRLPGPAPGGPHPPPPPPPPHGYYEQLLLSNCPPERLRRFIQTLRVKLAAAHQARTKPVSGRTRLLSNLPRTFETVSPVQARDLQRRGAPLAEVGTTPVKGGIGTLRGASRKKRARIGEPVDEEQQQRQQVAERQQVKKSWSMCSRATLSQEQLMVLSAVLSGKNVFFTGSAGTGKSFLLKKIIASLPPNSTYATASTGVAACQIGGTTLHAFAGIGSGNAPIHQCIELAQRHGVRQQWLTCHHLIIDEISMVEGEFFDKLEAVGRAVRKCEDPFGGIQLIICGDFLQLPPVSKSTERPKFCFQAKSWQKCIHLNMELTEVRRQTDSEFVSLLNMIRLGRCTEEVTRQLTVTAMHRIERNGILATRLCTHKDDVELMNTRQLQDLPGETNAKASIGTGEQRSFKAVDSDPLLVKMIDAQCPVSSVIELKQGAQVMLTKNLDVSRGLVNGARGVVIGFETEGKGLPKVRFICGVTNVVGLERWVLKGPAGTHLTRQQLPLKLAWAISIHKSQGMSLDCAEVSLVRVFEYGQAYVALSRARSFAGLRVLDFDPKVVRANPCVLQFYRQLRKDKFLAQSSLHSYLQADKENRSNVK